MSAFNKAKNLGYVVKLKHHRRKDGGVTTRVALIKDDEVKIGESKCHPDDQFSRKIARERAIGLTLKGKQQNFAGLNQDILKALVNAEVFHFDADKACEEAEFYGVE